MDIGHIKFVRPKHPTLQQWIKGYYVHSSDKVDFHTKVTFYQNITTTISIYKDSTTRQASTKSDVKGRLRIQEFSKDTGFHSVLVGLVDKYQEVEFMGPLDRIAIVFYPFGINQFLRKPLSTLLARHYSAFHYFDTPFESFLPVVFSEQTIARKRDLLDDFFLSRYIPHPDTTLLKAVELLTKTDAPMQVSSMATRLGISRRTLLRKFKKHLGYSVEEYISIIKFRKALLHFQQQRGKEKMIDIALSSHYYDQADFNHQIKFRSDLPPKELFKQLEIVDDTLFWKL